MDTKTLQPAAEHWSSRLKPRPVIARSGVGQPASSGRWANRRRVGMTGYIRIGRHDAPVACNIVDISSTGALLSLGANGGNLTVDDMPAELTLIFWRNRETSEVDCGVVRRSGHNVAVRFVSPFQTFVQPKRNFPKSTRAR